SFGTQAEGDVLLGRAITPEAEGWAECVAMEEPLYSSEYVDAAQAVMRDHLLPRLFALDDATGAAVSPALHAVKGHLMAKAALETTILDAELRTAGVRLADHLGAVRDA